MSAGRRRAVVIVCALAAASCAGGSDGGSSTGSTGTSTTLGEAATTTIADTTTVPAPTTTVASPQVGDIASSTLDPTTVALHASRDGNDGLLAVQETVDLFAAVYGPVPGADADRFDVGPRGGTMAVRNVFRVWGELTPDQRAAVTDLLGLDPSEAPTGLRSRTPPAALQTEEQVLLVAESIRDEIAGLLGVDLAMGLDVVLRESYPAGGEAIPFGRGVAYAEPYDTCRLVVRVPTVADEQLTTTIAHELFHCFQYASPGDSDAVPDWIIEGQAQWVGARVGGADADVHVTIAKWFQGITSSLFGMDYDAIGFYYVLEQAGVDPWDVMLGMLGRSNADAVAATGLSPAEAARWMATTSGHADHGPAVPVSAIWQIAAPEPQWWSRDGQTVTEDSPYMFDSGLPSYSAAGMWIFTLEEEMATVELTAAAGAFEFFDQPATLFEGNFSGEFCIRPEGCECGPDDAPGLMEGSEQMVLGVGSLGDAVSVAVLVEDIDDGGFTDGHWEGTLSATPIRTDVGGELETRGNTTAAPFAFDVAEGEVEGVYSVEMDQTIDGPDLHAEGVGTVNGAVTGCWFSPRLEPTGFSFRGTITLDGVTSPFNFDVPFDGEPTPAGTPTSSFHRWDFDVAEDDVASGSLETSVFLEFMRSVGVNVNDVELTFQATRTGGGAVGG